MPVTQTLLTSGSDETDASSYTTLSVTPAANKLIVVSVHTRRSAANNAIPTLSGNGITWTWIDGAAGVGNANRTDMFRGLSSSPSTGAITIDYGGLTQQAAHWAVEELTDVDTATNQGVVQSATGSSTGTSLTITLAAFGNSGNAAFGYIGVNRADIANIAPGTGFTEVVETTLTNERAEAEFKNTEDTTVDWSWDGNGGAEGVGVAIEIKWLVGMPDVVSTLRNIETPIFSKTKVVAY